MDPTGSVDTLLASGNVAIAALLLMVVLLVTASGVIWRAYVKTQDEKMAIIVRKFDTDLKQAEVDRERTGATRELTRVIEVLTIKIEAGTS